MNLLNINPFRRKSSLEHLKYDKTLKILILGESSVGKSYFLHKSCKNVGYSKKKVNGGLDFHIKTVRIKKKSYKLQIWETTGEEQFRCLIPMYCKGTNGVIFIYDITEPESLGLIDSFSGMIKEAAGDIPILLLGNKIDMKSKRAIPKKKAKEISDNYNNSSYMEVSSKTGKNVNKVFKNLTKEILSSCQT
jgi:small GTP-binding protein